MTKSPTEIGRLEFDLLDFDARKHFEVCVKAKDLVSCIWDINQICREALKYNESLNEEAEKILERIQEECAPYIDLLE